MKPRPSPFFMLFDIERPLAAPHRGEKGGQGATAMARHVKTQTQSNGCDGRISIVHFQKLSSPPPPPPPPPTHNSPAPKKKGIGVGLYGGFVKRAVMTPILHDVTVGEESVCVGVWVCGGGEQLKKKARMIQSLRIRDFRRKMDIGVET